MNLKSTMLSRGSQVQKTTHHVILFKSSSSETVRKKIGVRLPQGGGVKGSRLSTAQEDPQGNILGCRKRSTARSGLWFPR